ncbi:aspartate aminotransferase family protein [Frankia sp. QA3]|uniref:aspartate aminotransferase family protein n=1 Tax=Frankia sp. QA3 TaxID=710111 RepID=UPI000269BF0E|nr:aminotransferase class III-fold pyridoxal phosphate-dependent enzyme [Frankia sp. QA3]EIV92730.1 ornithine/acetylornithine aminotransferase [Frankia sp. QA3]
MSSPTAEAELELTEPTMRGWLSTIGLDAVYVRAEGNTLYAQEGAEEIPVLDYVGGYGSLIFGHNNPRIVARAQTLLAEQVPVHAQFSRHPYANDVARLLNTIIGRELGTDEPYSAIFANSGAEAVEVAIKHAELDRVLRAATLGEQIAAEITAARAAYRGDPAEFDGLAADVAAHNLAAMATPPVVLAVEGSFHGKLVASSQLTHNEGFRTPFQALSRTARFIPLNDGDALKRIVVAEQAFLRSLVVEQDALLVAERPLPVFTAFLVEPIQGEGGIRMVTEEFAAEVQRTCATIGCPVIVDEIQSGMGRTGTFLASTAIGLRGDYYTQGKSLGGGLAKTAVMLTRTSTYRPEFEFLHSSTFAKDAFSCHIAHTVLEMLEADGGAAYATARERGDRLKLALDGLRVDFPDVVKDVRGRGLMLGLEFQDQSHAPADQIREAAQAGVFCYVIAGYLYRQHRIRVFPTASATHTMRFEPSIHLTDAEIGRLDSAMRTPCALLREQRGDELTTL